jgi:hypothetical protein
VSLSGRAYAIGRAVASAAPAGVRRRLLGMRRFSTQTTIFHLPEHNIVYVKTPKVGTGSVLAALTAFAAGEKTVDEQRATEKIGAAIPLYQKGAFAPEIRRLSRQCFTFTFVRNPLDRLLSAYSHQVNTRRDEGKTIFIQHRIPFDVSFPEFVRAVAELPDEGANVHIRSQHKFSTDEEGVIVEFIGRFERLADDWQALMDRFGFPALPRRHVSVHSHYSEAYTPELARVAAERYVRDIELFGYKEEVARLTG